MSDLFFLWEEIEDVPKALFAIVHGPQVHAERELTHSISPITTGNIYKIMAEFSGAGSIASIDQGTPEHRDLSIPTSLTTNNNDETPSNTGFTPLIEQQARFGALKSSKTPTIYPGKRGTHPVCGLSTTSAALLSLDDIFGLTGVSKADFSLEKAQGHTIKSEPNGTIKNSKDEFIQIKQKIAIYETVDNTLGKVIGSTVRNTTNLDLKALKLSTSSTTLKSHELTVAFTTFTIFNKLPIELRIKIWRHATPTDRVVEFTIEGKTKDVFKPRKSAGVPGVLQACHESRTEVRKILKPMFCTTAGADKYLYFNPETDVLKLTLKDAKLLAKTNDINAQQDRDKVKILECPAHMDPNDYAMPNAIASLILHTKFRSWGALETLYLSGRKGHQRKVKIGFKVKLPKTVGTAEELIGKYTVVIADVFRAMKKKHGRRADLTFFVAYE